MPSSASQSLEASLNRWNRTDFVRWPEGKVKFGMKLEMVVGKQKLFGGDHAQRTCFGFVEVDLDVSKNRGTPKWMVYNEKPY